MNANTVLAAVQDSEKKQGAFMSVRVTDTQRKQLGELAQEYGTTRNAILAELIAQFLDSIYPPK